MKLDIIEREATSLVHSREAENDRKLRLLLFFRQNWLISVGNREQTPEKLRKTEQVSYDIWQSANVCLQDVCCGDVHLKFFPINVQNYVVQEFVILHLCLTFMRAHIERLLLVMYGCV